MFLRCETLERIMCNSIGSAVAIDFAMLYLVSYTFLLRVPSEALPIVWSGAKWPSVESTKASIVLADGRLGLQLARRKNKETPSTFWRACWCKTSSATCPVHVLGRWFSRLPLRCAPFSKISSSAALARLREVLTILKGPEAAQYRTHDLRRGHADDMRRAGATLAEILAAGGWKSAAFRDYLDMHAVEEDAIFEAHFCDSSDSD